MVLIIHVPLHTWMYARYLVVTARNPFRLSIIYENGQNLPYPRTDERYCVFKGLLIIPSAQWAVSWPYGICRHLLR